MQLYLKPFYKKDEWIIETNTPFKQDADFETLTHRYYILWINIQNLEIPQLL